MLTVKKLHNIILRMKSKLVSKLDINSQKLNNYMEEKVIFLFLDWVLTINELIQNDKIVEDKFDKFIDAINKIEESYKAKVKFVIVSGTKFSNAKKVFKILQQAFKNVNRKNVFCGFAYEYGAYIINDSNHKIKMIDAPLSSVQLQEIEKITNFFGYKIDREFKSCCTVDFDCFNDKTIEYIECLKKYFPELDFEIYDDKYGQGVDIKNTQLNKGSFVKLYLDKFEKILPYMIIVGGDSEQDIKMLPNSFDCDKYFIGFSGEQKKHIPNSILSKKQNIDGIIECIKRISKSEL